MSSSHNEGRISKRVFVVSNSTLFVICLLCICGRYYVRLRVQKQFSADDGILLFGVLCLICGMSLLYTFVDPMYLVGAATMGTPGMTLPPDFIQQSFKFQKLAIVGLTLTWFSIVSVKFSYLLLFKRLIDRIRPMVIYWWIVAVYTGMISVYGASAYYAACPYFYSLKSLQCAWGEGRRKSMRISISAMILDVFSDLLILYIPCHLIWGIKVRPTQKIVLCLTLCLTIITIMATITRMAGTRNPHARMELVDANWLVYWQYVTANIALSMTAATAFRTFFVAKGIGGSPPSSRSKSEWYLKGRRLIRIALSPRSWRFKSSANISGNSGGDAVVPEITQVVPRGTMTGVLTFINGRSRSPVTDDSQYIRTLAEEENMYPLPASTKNGNEQVIMVQQDVTLRRDDAC